MATTNERSLGMLKTALEMEEKGKSFYQMAVATCENQVGREIFTTLMNDELVHTERIKAIYAQLEGGGHWDDAWLSFKIDHGDVKPVFRNLAAKLGKEITANTNDLDALKVGIEFEQKSVDYYAEHLSLTTDSHEKRFLERMVAEEKGHRSVLQDMHAYLSDPASWFAERERSGYDGA
jgi:rubrerythrin